MTPSPFQRVCVVGLGKLGLHWACVLVSKGIEVVGIDTAPEIVQIVKCAVYRGHEPDVARLLSQHPVRLIATEDYAAVENTQAAFVSIQPVSK